MRALRSADVDLRFIGRGGPQMKAVAGAAFKIGIDKSGVSGCGSDQTLRLLSKTISTRRYEKSRQASPNAVVLIDYPGFNLRLARALSASPGLRRINPDIY